MAALIPVGTPTLAKMRSRAYFLADETPNDVFLTQDVDDSINAGIAVILDKVGFPDTKASTSALVGQAEYPLEDADLDRGYQAQVSAVVLDGKALSLTTASGARIDAGTPTNYYVDGGSVFLSPVPDAVGVLEVTYKKAATPLVAPTDYSPLNPAASELACVYAAYLMKLKDDEYNSADRLKARFDELLRQIAGPRLGVHKGV